MQTLNAVHLIGRIGQEPSMRYLPTGTCRTRLRLATDRPVREGAAPETDWHNVVCWGKTGEFAGEYLEKGRLVYIAGRITYREYTTPDGERRQVTEIVAQEIVVLDHRPAREVDDDVAVAAADAADEARNAEDESAAVTEAVLPALAVSRGGAARNDAAA